MIYKSTSRNILQKADSLIDKVNSVQREAGDLRDVVKNGDTVDYSNLPYDFPVVEREELDEICDDLLMRTRSRHKIGASNVFLRYSSRRSSI